MINTSSPKRKINSPKNNQNIKLKVNIPLTPPKGQFSANRVIRNANAIQNMKVNISPTNIRITSPKQSPKQSSPIKLRVNVPLTPSKGQFSANRVIRNANAIQNMKVNISPKKDNISYINDETSSELIKKQKARPSPRQRPSQKKQKISISTTQNNTNIIPEQTSSNTTQNNCRKLINSCTIEHTSKGVEATTFIDCPNGNLSKIYDLKKKENQSKEDNYINLLNSLNSFINTTNTTHFLNVSSCQDEDNIYESQKFIKGITLNEFIKTNNNNENFISKIYNYIEQVISAIDLLYKNNLYHNDVHTKNIIIENDNIIIIDYGMLSSDYPRLTNYNNIKSGIIAKYKGYLITINSNELINKINNFINSDNILLLKNNNELIEEIKKNDINTIDIENILIILEKREPIIDMGQFLLNLINDLNDDNNFQELITIVKSYFNVGKNKNGIQRDDVNCINYDYKKLKSEIIDLCNIKNNNIKKKYLKYKIKYLELLKKFKNISPFTY